MRRVPSVKTLARITDRPELVREALTTGKLGAFINAHCPQTAVWARRCYHDPLIGHDSRVEVRMKAADEIMKTYDVCALYGPHVWSRYWQETEVTYCNIGDSYAPTLLYRPRTDSFSVGSWGDIMERHPNWR